MVASSRMFAIKGPVVTKCFRTVRGMCTASTSSSTNVPVQQQQPQKRDSDLNTSSRGSVNPFGRPDTSLFGFPTSAFGIWDPLQSSGASRSLRQMLDTMNRVFDTSFSDVRGGGLRSPWDVSEKEDSYYLRVDIPGFDKSDVKVHLEGSELVISAEHNASEGTSELFESKKSMNTRMSLPEDALKEGIKAEVKNGVMIVVIPKQKSPKREIVDVPIA